MKAFFLAILLFLFFPLAAAALGLSVRPAQLEIIVPDKSAASLSIKNISLEPMSISIYADAFATELKINPSELSLMPEESAAVEVAFAGSRDQGGVKKTNLSILARSLDQKRFNAASGLKIPLTIYFPAKVLFWTKYLFIATLLFGVLLGGALFRSFYFYWRRRQQKRKNIWLKVNFLGRFGRSRNWLGRRR
ncbi:MAG: hypothetical protein PHO91_00450 [Patescibacteria group bacterium]|nr:hypothetical protein [Patescibacteria group bacterium]